MHGLAGSFYSRSLLENCINILLRKSVTGKGSEEVASDAISAGVTDYLQKGTGTEQYELLANRIANAVEAARTRERAARQTHINTLIREINRRLVAAKTVEEIEHAVCEALTDSEPYRFAWIGEPDPESGEVIPRASAGDAEAYLDEVTIYCDDRPRGQGPGGRAVRTREMQLAQNIPDDPSFDPWDATAEKYGYESAVVIPISRGDDFHGILAIYADHPHAFGEVERAVLAELSETIGSALDAAETRRHLDARKTSEISLRERFYRTLGEALPNGAVALFDSDLQYTLVGGAVFEGLDISAADLEGERLVDAHSPSFQREYLDHYRAALDGEERSFTFEFEGRRFEAHVAPVRDEDGTVVGGLAMAQDVTDRSS